MSGDTAQVKEVEGGTEKDVKGIQRSIKELRDAGNAHIAKGAWQRAIHCYSKAINLDDASAVLYSNRAAAKFLAQQFEDALTDADKVIELDSSFWKGYKWKAQSLVSLNRFDEAIKVYEKALKLEPDNKDLKDGLENAQAQYEQSQNLYVLPGPEMMKKLDGIPVFIVTDEKGQPFFITYEDGQQVCTFFFEYSDAVASLDWIKQENPDLGKSALVVAISLSHSFQLAQDTQQQYAKSQEEGEANAEADAGTKEAPKQPEGKPEGESEGRPEGEPEGEPEGRPEGKPEDDAGTSETTEEKPVTEQKGSDENKDTDDLDANVPLAFQFRPELRQVEAAVELYKNPHLKKVVRKKKSEQSTDAGSSEAQAGEDQDNKPDEAKERQPETAAEGGADSTPADKADAEQKEGTQPATGDAEAKVDDADEGKSAGKQADTENAEHIEREEEEEELTVDNYNGIPLFQAQGLTITNEGTHYIPLFFSKADLETAWRQLSELGVEDMPEETEIDVGTLENVLRSMVEGDAKEFENVIFIPTTESLKHVGREFPLDELSNSAFGRSVSKKSNNFEKARKIAASGGSREAVREAIQAELMEIVDKQKYAEQLDRIAKSKDPKAKPVISRAMHSRSAVKPRKKRQPASATTSTTAANVSERMQTTPTQA